MKFGVGFFTAQQPPGSSRSYADIYGDLLDHARLIDAVGLDSFWITEHHFCDDGYLASPITVCSAIASITERITLGCGVMAPFTHPIRLAEDLIALDLISGGGRLIVQVGSGYKAEEFTGFGIDRASRGDRLLETVAILRAAFAGRPFSHSGPYHQAHDLELVPSPATPGGPPLMVAGNSVDAARLSARLGALYKIDASDTWEEARRFAAAYRGFGEEGAAGKDLHIQCYGFVSDGDPWAEVVDGFIYMREAYDRWGWTQARPASREPANYRLLLGNADQVADQVAQYRAEFGDAIHITLRLSYPGMDPQVVERAIRLWGEVAEHMRA